MRSGVVLEGVAFESVTGRPVDKRLILVFVNRGRWERLFLEDSSIS